MTPTRKDVTTTARTLASTKMTIDTSLATSSRVRPTGRTSR